jgi:hypothetical protein
MCPAVQGREVIGLRTYHGCLLKQRIHSWNLVHREAYRYATESAVRSCRWCDEGGTPSTQIIEFPMATESTSGFASGNPSNLRQSQRGAGGQVRATDLGRKVSDTADQAPSNAGLSNAADAIVGKLTRLRLLPVAPRIVRPTRFPAVPFIRDNSARDMMDDAIDVAKTPWHRAFGRRSDRLPCWPRVLFAY